jgi:hypothetical protein
MEGIERHAPARAAAARRRVAAARLEPPPPHADRRRSHYRSIVVKESLPNIDIEDSSEKNKEKQTQRAFKLAYTASCWTAPLWRATSVAKLGSAAAAARCCRLRRRRRRSSSSSSSFARRCCPSSLSDGDVSRRR